MSFHVAVVNYNVIVANTVEGNAIYLRRGFRTLLQARRFGRRLQLRAGFYLLQEGAPYMVRRNYFVMIYDDDPARIQWYMWRVRCPR
jgi:hypothetical protein